MTYHIGQECPQFYTRGIVHGPEIAPVWHALIVPPQKERAVRERLRAIGVYAFYPSEEFQRTIAGKRRKMERPIVTRLVFAQFRQAPQWDVMKEQRRLILGVYCNNGRPIEFGPTVIKRLQGLTVEADRLREERAEMLRVREGDRARIIAGPLKGFMVEVDSVESGEALFHFVTGGKGKADLKSIERDV